MRIVIAEDEALLREGLVALLRQRDLDVVAAVGDADALMAAVEELRPDLVLTDIRMPPNRADDGLAAALTIRQRYPDIRVMVVSQHVQRRYALELLADVPVGVGYLLKERIADIDDFVQQLRQVAAGGIALDPDVVEVMLARADRRRDSLAALTARQREVLALIAEGRSNGAVATRLGITEKAVVQHVSHIYDQLGLPPSSDDHRRVLAVLRYLAATVGP